MVKEIRSRRKSQDKLPLNSTTDRRTSTTSSASSSSGSRTSRTTTTSSSTSSGSGSGGGGMVDTTPRTSSVARSNNCGEISDLSDEVVILTETQQREKLETEKKYWRDAIKAFISTSLFKEMKFNPPDNKFLITMKMAAKETPMKTIPSNIDAELFCSFHRGAVSKAITACRHNSQVLARRNYQRTDLKNVLCDWLCSLSCHCYDYY